MSLRKIFGGSAVNASMQTATLSAMSLLLTPAKQAGVLTMVFK